MKLYLHIKELDDVGTTCRNSVYIDLEFLCFNISQIITDQFDETTEFYIQELICIASSPCLTPASRSRVIDIANTDFIRLNLAINIERTELISHIRTVLIAALKQRYNIQELSDIDANMHSLLLTPFLTLDEELPNPDRSCAYVAFPPIGKDWTYLKRYKVNKFLQCAFVMFNTNETIIINDTLILSIQDKNVSFAKDEYDLKIDIVIICINDFNAKTNNFDDERTLQADDEAYANALNIFTQFCTIISLVSIFLTFITYCLFSCLRTIPGKGVMLLCLSLFCAQASLQFGLNGSSKSIACIITGIAIHYFWIALFCAMNICSFHMFRVFYFSDLSNQLPQNKTILSIKYLLYFLLWPLVFVAVAVSINLFHSNLTTVGYGVNYCFISDFYIFVGTFLVPACLICLSNFIFFSLAFHKIRSTPDVQSNQDKNNFHIFLKLSILVGITWPLLIIDNILGISWFSFVAAGINSLQGVFVFISFILNKRVIYLYKSKFVKVADKNVSRSDVSTTYSIINKTRV